MTGVPAQTGSADADTDTLTGRYGPTVTVVDPEFSEVQTPFLTTATKRVVSVKAPEV